MIISDAIAMVEHDLQARHDCPENYDPDFTRALETVLKENTRLTEENISLRANVQILRDHLANERDEATIAQSKLVGEIERLRSQLGKANERILQLQTGSERYWELRWRDEHAANEALRDTIAALTDD